MSPLYNVGDIVHLIKSRRSEFLEITYGDLPGVIVNEIGDEERKRIWLDQRYIELLISTEEDIQPELLDSLF